MGKSTKTEKVILFMVLSVSIVVSFSNDVFISGLPQIGEYFHTTQASLIISVYFLGLAVAQPLYGPLSDRFGRKPVLLFGLWLMTLSSMVTMLAPSFPLLLVGRFFQALGTCGGLISALAIARDCFKQDELIKATSIIMAMVGISPAIAPLIGSIFLDDFGWRSGFAYPLVLGIFFLILITFFFNESLKVKNLKALKIRHMAHRYFCLLRVPSFLNCSIISGLSYGVLFSYFGLSAKFIIVQFGFSPIEYGVIVCLNAIGILLMAIWAPWLSKRFSLNRIVKVGIIAIAAGGLIMWLTNYSLPNTIYTFMLPMFITTIGVGLIRPTACACAMGSAPRNIIGSTAAMYNFISFVGGALATTLSASLVQQVSGFGVFILTCGIVGMLFAASNSMPYLKTPRRRLA